MRFILYSGLFLLFFKGGHCPLFSQTVDSVLRLPDDSIKLQLLKKQATALAEDDPDKCLQLTTFGLALSVRLKSPVSSGEWYKLAGVAYDVKGNLDSCLYFLNKAKNIFEKEGETLLLSNTVSDIAIAYYLRGIYELSLRYHFESLRIREQAGEKNLIAKSYNNIGLIYRARKDYRNAIRYYQQSLILKKQMGDSSGQLNSLMNIGSCYQYQQQYDSAGWYAGQTLILSRLLGKSKDEINSLANAAVAAAGLAQWENAKENLQTALEMANRISYKEPLFSIYEGMGNLNLHYQNYREAIGWFNKGVLLAASSGRRELLANYYHNLAECYEKSGDYNQAYNFIRNSSAIQDSLLNEENLRQINEMNALYETSKKEATISVLNKEGIEKEAALKRSRKERNYFILATVLFLALAGLAFYAYRNNRRQKDLLNHQKQMIENSLQEKEVLLKEIHHRVKNNLQIISGLLNLQSRQIENPEAQEAVREGRNRVKSMALIHQKLYQQDNLSGVNMSEYLYDLLATIQQTFRNNQQTVDSRIICDNLNLDVDTAIPLGLIINELVTNCYKYAFPGQKKGKLYIRLEETDRILILEVVDNGPGMPPGFELEKSRTFGMKLIQSLATKLSAEIYVSNESGLCFRLHIHHYQKVSI
ncbi:MAG TPA: histidine kinase dimerization/phosphoacceptor domain -containing protein [Chitinophagaceae bacterium]|nr:histidine kinase dimerization/phosphoacceptor domain -containing protein [Chitinophagaceae bacterium]